MSVERSLHLHRCRGGVAEIVMDVVLAQSAQVADHLMTKGLAIGSLDVLIHVALVRV